MHKPALAFNWIATRASVFEQYWTHSRVFHCQISPAHILVYSRYIITRAPCKNQAVPTQHITKQSKMCVQLSFGTYCKSLQMVPPTFLLITYKPSRRTETHASYETTKVITPKKACNWIQIQIHCDWIHGTHYNDVIMNAMASQITGIRIVYSTACSDANERKHQSTKCQ